MIYDIYILLIFEAGLTAPTRCRNCPPSDRNPPSLRDKAAGEEERRRGEERKRGEEERRQTEEERKGGEEGKQREEGGEEEKRGGGEEETRQDEDNNKCSYSLIMKSVESLLLWFQTHVVDSLQNLNLCLCVTCRCL